MLLGYEAITVKRTFVDDKSSLETSKNAATISELQQSKYFQCKHIAANSIDWVCRGRGQRKEKEGYATLVGSVSL